MRTETGPSSPSGLLRTLAAVFSGVLFGLFLSKSRAPYEDRTESVHPQDTADEETYNAPPIVGSNSPPSPAPEDNSKGNANNTPTWKKWVEISIAAGTLGLLGVNILLWHSTRKAADAAASAANTAQKALQVTQQQFRMDERPYIWTSAGPDYLVPGPSGQLIPQVLVIGKPIGIRVDFKNGGKSPAIDVEFDLVHTRIEPTREALENINRFVHKERAIADKFVAAGDSRTIGDTDTSNEKLTAEIRDKINNEALTVYVTGLIHYTDLFQPKIPPYQTPYCWIYKPKGLPFAPCDLGNDNGFK